MKIAVAGGLRNFLTIEKYDSMENDPKDATLYITIHAESRRGTVKDFLQVHGG